MYRLKYVTNFSQLGSIWSRFYQLALDSFVCVCGVGVWGCVCVFIYKTPRSLEKNPFGFCQTDNLQFSFTVYCYIYGQLTCLYLEVSEFRFLRYKSTKRISLVIHTEILHSNSCLLEFRK